MDDRGVHAAALAALEDAGSRRLNRLLAGRPPAVVWEQVRRGAVADNVAPPELRAAWRRQARELDLSALRRRLDEVDARVTTPVDADHPSAIRSDIDPAPILFRCGRLVDATAPAVAIVGTRRCTPTGRSIALELGAGLAERGVAVVSGLALGIDGSAHRGALTADGAPVVGVAGSGIDMVYPRGNADLWRAVKAEGTLLSEAPLGAEPLAWRFPARNRLLAALADVVVVVESRKAGGSLLTVSEAIRRGVTVMAVPGSLRNPAAAGTNLLLSEGCPPVCSTIDVLVALGLANKHPSGAIRKVVDPRTDLEPLHQRMLDALEDAPASLDSVVLKLEAPVLEVLSAADELERRGLLAREGGMVMRA